MRVVKMRHKYMLQQTSAKSNVRLRYSDDDYNEEIR